MLRPRIIPSLLIHNRGLVKTIQFDDPKYVGDPINAVKIFNEKQVDELFVADIDASRYNREPDFDLISKLAAECRMPLTYAGGVKEVSQVERIISLGVEKVGISSGAINNLELISKSAERVGSQSVLGIIDVKKSGFLKTYEVFIHNAKDSTGLKPDVFAKELQEAGAGEVLLNSVDRDGTMKGFDLNLIDSVYKQLSIPMTAVGGAGNLDHFRELFEKHNLIGASAGSLFVFKGKYRAVLIQYPDLTTKEQLFPNI
jgi:cyclase